MEKRGRYRLQRLLGTARPVLPLVDGNRPEEEERHGHALALQKRQGRRFCHVSTKKDVTLTGIGAVTVGVVKVARSVVQFYLKTKTISHGHVLAACEWRQTPRGRNGRGRLRIVKASRPVVLNNNLASQTRALAQ